jgi:hypothetical protein
LQTSELFALGWRLRDGAGSAANNLFGEKADAFWKHSLKCYVGPDPVNDEDSCCLAFTPQAGFLIELGKF